MKSLNDGVSLSLEHRIRYLRRMAWRPPLAPTVRQRRNSSSWCNQLAPAHDIVLAQKELRHFRQRLAAQSTAIKGRSCVASRCMAPAVRHAAWVYDDIAPNKRAPTRWAPLQVGTKVERS